jgi:hypothetical protein
VTNVFGFFNEVLGTTAPRDNLINLTSLGLPKLNPAGLGIRFMEEEVWQTIRALPTDKAPSPPPPLRLHGKVLPRRLAYHLSRPHRGI